MDLMAEKGPFLMKAMRSQQIIEIEKIVPYPFFLSGGFAAIVPIIRESAAVPYDAFS